MPPTRPVTSVSRASRVASPSPRSRFLFMHLADPKKAPIRGEGRRKSEVGRMLRRPAGQEDLGELDAADEDAIDPVLRNILGMGGSGGGDGAGSVVSAGSGGGGSEGGSGGGAGSEFSGGSEARPEDEDEDDGEQESSEPRGGRRAAHRRGGHRRSSRPTSAAMNLPPRGSAPLRSQALGYVSLLRGGGDGDEESGSRDDDSEDGSGSGRAGTKALLRGRILQAARGILGDKGGARSLVAASRDEEARVEDMPFASYAERRAVLREDRDRKIQARMMEMVHKGQMPPELLLDEDLAQSSKLDADSYENDPDAYETEELLGSDVSSISSTDDDNDTPQLAARRARRRDRRRKDKIRVLKRRRRKLWAKKRRDIEDAKSRYYDDMIDELVRSNPLLRPPAAAADLETKRAFVDRATAENITRSKIDQMARWIYVVAVVVENLGMVTGFLMLEGLSQAVDAELRKPEMQPVIAQLARKYLRRGPSSPEWGLAIMFLGTAGTVHAMNVRQQEIAQASAGQGSATGPGSSKFGRVVSGAMKVLKVLGLAGGGGGGGPAPGGMPEGGGMAEAAIAARYEAQAQSEARAASARPASERPATSASRATSRGSIRIQDDDDEGSRAPWE
jgi:hypothetical protein